MKINPKYTSFNLLRGLEAGVSLCLSDGQRTRSHTHTESYRVRGQPNTWHPTESLHFSRATAFMVSSSESVFGLDCLAESVGDMSRSSLLNLNSLGRICGSSQSSEMIVLDRVKRKNSVRRMSIIEDGHLAEVLYLIPKRYMMEQLPFINPNDYILCEKLAGIPAEVSGNQ